MERKRENPTNIDIYLFHADVTQPATVVYWFWRIGMIGLIGLVMIVVVF